MTGMMSAGAMHRATCMVHAQTRTYVALAWPGGSLSPNRRHLHLICPCLRQAGAYRIVTSRVPRPTLARRNASSISCETPCGQSSSPTPSSGTWDDLGSAAVPLTIRGPSAVPSRTPAYLIMTQNGPRPLELIASQQSWVRVERNHSPWQQIHKIHRY
jgi:hypothetical protein